MKTLKEYISEAEKNHTAIGHFNISTMDALWGIAQAAKNVGVPVIIGLSEGEREFFGMKQAALAVKSISEELGVPMFVNADHTYSFEKVKEAVDAGVDAVIFDGTKLPADERITITKRCVSYAGASGRSVLVEGELGFIGTSSKLLDKLPEGVELTGPIEAAHFAEVTGVDMLAPAVGNIHGMLKDAPNPRLDIVRIGEIKKNVSVPLVLHGGSGISDDDFRAAIKAGVSIIHINTEIRVAWKDAVKNHLAENPDDVAPYQILKGAREAVRMVAEKRLKLFSGR
ncbi:MAG: class II fructose-bisphosphate aldolase [Candidatus Lloydbacteria bacterium]|nr:class II fructose-bisphosphate aldolase [Candidatus Lloydbacteria bacterium]